MSSKIITYDELKANSTKDSLYVLLHEKGSFPHYSQLERARYTDFLRVSVQCHQVP